VDFNTPVYQLAEKILGCMSSASYLELIRVSPIDNFRANVLGTFGLNFPGQLSSSMSEKNDAIEFRYPAANGTSPFSNRWLHAVPKNMIATNGELKIDGDYSKAAQALNAQLVSGNWGWLGSVGRVQTPIGNITQVANQLTVQLTLAANTFPAPFGKIVSVFVSGVRGAAILNRQLRVRTIDAVTCVTTKPYPFFPYTGGGKLTYNTLGLVKPKANLNRGGIYNLSDRKTGRTFFEHRGRRPVQKVA
jgi:hypothetical protein